MKVVSGIILAGLLSTPGFAQPVAQQIWRSDRVERPEAVHMPDIDGWAYIGNFGPENRDAAGYISRLHLATGEFQQYWASGFNGPLGIISSDQHLYFSDRDRVLILDRQSGEELAEIAAPAGSELLNDLALDDHGRLWATDTRTATIFRHDAGQWSAVAEGEDFTSANGIEFVDGWIYVVCSGDVGNLIRIDPETLEYTVMLRDEGSLDGVVTDGRGGLVLSDLHGRLLHWSETGGVHVLDAFADEDLMLNSIGGTPDGRIILSPHWRQSELSAHVLHYPEPAR